LLDVTVEVAIREKVDVWGCLGDLCNPNTSRSHRAIAKAIAVDQKLRNNDITTFWVTGNHDVIEDGTGGHVMLELREAKAVIFDQPLRGLLTTDSGGELRYIALPYTPRSHSYDPDAFIRKCKAQERRSDLPLFVFGHLNLDGIAAGGEVADMPRGRDVFWPLDALAECFPNALLVGGHYHTRQIFKGVNIIGSLGRVTHTQDGDDPGFYILEA